MTDLLINRRNQRLVEIARKSQLRVWDGGVFYANTNQRVENISRSSVDELIAAGFFLMDRTGNLTLNEVMPNYKVQDNFNGGEMSVGDTVIVRNIRYYPVVAPWKDRGTFVVELMMPFGGYRVTMMRRGYEPRIMRPLVWARGDGFVIRNKQCRHRYHGRIANMSPNAVQEAYRQGWIGMHKDGRFFLHHTGERLFDPD